MGIEGVLRVCSRDCRALFRETGFLASNASSFFARARRCFKVSFGFADFFRFAVLELVDRVLRRFACRFFFAISVTWLLV